MNKILISLIILTLILPMVIAGSCNEDGKIKCTSKTSLQICTDWDGTGMKYGYCDDGEIDFCLDQPNIDECLSDCVGNKLILTLGNAAEEFNVEPKPPTSLYNKQFGCMNGDYWEVFCSSNAVGITRDECISGTCDGDVCANSVRECDTPGIKSCLNSRQYQICLASGNSGTVWSEPIDCGKSETCQDGECVSEQPFDMKLIVIILGIGILVYGIYKSQVKGGRK